MGLDTTHDAWHGPYSAFREFRDELGKVSGFNVKNYDWDSITNEQLLGHWGDVKPEIKDGIYDTPRHDPILYLLIHQDCEGEIEYQHLPGLMKSLETLRSNFDLSDYTEESLDQFIEGIKSAIDAGQSLGFH